MVTMFKTPAGIIYGDATADGLSVKGKLYSVQKTVDLGWKAAYENTMEKYQLLNMGYAIMDAKMESSIGFRLSAGLKAKVVERCRREDVNCSQLLEDKIAQCHTSGVWPAPIKEVGSASLCLRISYPAKALLTERSEELGCTVGHLAAAILQDWVESK